MIHMLQFAMFRFNSSRYRRLFLLCVIVLGVSVGVLSTTFFVRWQTLRTVSYDRRLLLQQGAQQLKLTLQSRRGTLTLLRDTLEKTPRLSETERQTLARSAVAHTPQLFATGLMAQGGLPQWWVPPPAGTSHESAFIREEIARRVLRQQMLYQVGMGAFALTVVTPAGRQWLVVLEPVHMPSQPSSLLVACFDLHAFLSEAFEPWVQPLHPVQLIEGQRLLFQTSHWPSGNAFVPVPVVEQTLKWYGLFWTLQMPMGVASVPIAWLNALLAIFGTLAALSLAGMLWTTERLRQLATTDELTGLANRRRFLEQWQSEFERARRYGRDLSCLMIDIVGFKRINDSLGHQTGDLLLRQVAKELRTRLRQTDLLARYGGDEFIVALPETSRQQAALVAEKLRGLLIEGPWSVRPGVGDVRLSAGLSYIRPHDTPMEIIQRADEDLYASRQPARQSPLPLDVEPVRA